MAQIILYTEEMVGDNHPSKSDTLNRALLIEHADTGAHLNSYASLYEDTPAGSVTNIPTAGNYVKWVHSTAGLVVGIPFITSSTTNDDIAIGTSGAGDYDIFLSASVEGQAGMEVTLAIFVDGIRENKLTRTVELGGTHEHFPDSVDVKIGTIITGSVASLQSKDATYLQVQESAAATGSITDLSFEDVEAPKVINHAGRYDGTAAHEMECQVYNADIGADRVQHGGTAYNCMRSHDTTVITTAEPGVGADWASYWEADGSPISEPAWADPNVYDDAFDEVRSDTKDLPSNTVDYTRRWIVPGTHSDRKKYSDNNNVCRVRYIHNSSGTGSHNVYHDAISLQDDHAGASITVSDFISLSALQIVDARITTNKDSSTVVTTNVNFKVNRIKIG